MLHFNYIEEVTTLASLSLIVASEFWRH